MTRVIKTMLLWLLMAALPVHGQAAVMKSSCGPAHHATGPAVITADGYLHRHASDGHDCHHTVAKDAAADNAYANTADESASTAHAMHQNSYCGACAACCVGAVALPSVSLWFPGDGSTDTNFISLHSLVPGHVPAGLERPPRKLSA